MSQNTKFTQYLEQRQGYVHKMYQTFREIKFTIEETNHETTCIPVAIFSIAV